MIYESDIYANNYPYHSFKMIGIMTRYKLGILKQGSYFRSEHIKGVLFLCAACTLHHRGLQLISNLNSNQFLFFSSKFFKAILRPLAQFAKKIETMGALRASLSALGC